MFRPQRLSTLLVQQPVPSRLASVACSTCCANSFTLPIQYRSVVSFRSTFVTTANRCEQRPLGSQTAVSEPAIPETPAQYESPPKTKPKRRRRGYVYAAIFLLVGTSIGSLFRLSISPPPLPEPGTKEDAYIVDTIHEKAKKLPLVQALSSDLAWESWHAYEDRNQGQRGPSITSGPMSGCRGLAYQRIFHNKETGEMTSVIYFGGGLSGFPGVVHGGALATVLDESMGRCAIYRFPARTGVTANLDLTYKKPTLTNAFYVVRTRPVFVESDGTVGQDGTKKSDRKLWVQGTIETPEGKLCVEAKALFVVPKGTKPKPLAERW